jgi:hypothetical protein
MIQGTSRSQPTHWIIAIQEIKDGFQLRFPITILVIQMINAKATRWHKNS